jgi:two-component system, OmpR family, response regulator YxdJ
VCVGGAKIDVTPVEWSTLEQLVLNAEHVVLRERLMAAVWGPASDLNSNALDVHNGHVRKQLAAVGLADVIETIRGRGYMLRLQAASDPQAA